MGLHRRQSFRISVWMVDGVHHKFYLVSALLNFHQEDRVAFTFLLVLYRLSRMVPGYHRQISLLTFLGKTGVGEQKTKIMRTARSGS